MSRFGTTFEPGATVARALLICERVVIDPMTGQNFILGTLTGINAMALPITVMHFNVYSVIERGNDDLNDFYIGIFDPKGEAIVKAGIQIADWGAGIAENNMPLPGLMFKIEGDYSVQLFC